MKAGALLVLVFVVAGCIPVVGAADYLDVKVVGGGRLFDVDDMYPGSAASSDLKVTNNSPKSGSISLRIVDVVDAENGCTAPEARVDDTCGGLFGELGDQVLLTVQRVSGGGAGPALVDRVLLESLEDEVVLQDNLGAGKTSRFRLTLELPAESGNETQTDSVEFTVQIVGRMTLTAHDHGGDTHRSKGVAIGLGAQAIASEHRQR